MTRTTKARQKRPRGEIEALPSGALRVKVYAGTDPLSGRRHYLRETIPAGPKADAEAEAARVRLVNEVNERRNPRTRATVNQLMDRYLELLDVETTTRKRYEDTIRLHIRPLLGKLPIGKLNAETFDAFAKTLRTCREHCGGTKSAPHKCQPLTQASIRKVYTCLSGALKAAIRWQWITVNPLDQASIPKATKPEPKPPTLEQATAIVNEAFKDLPWGMFVWLAMTTGARRGELCAIRWDWLELDNAALWIQSSIGQDGNKTWEKTTKSHQQRRITLDPETVGLLRAYRQHCEADAKKARVHIASNGRLFSPLVDHSTWLKPATVSQRYRRMCAKLKWDMNLHQLRHYSATELIASGVDVRTVAGRLGHSGGGTTTLKVYSAWVAEADQRAAGRITGRMPKAPIEITEHGDPRSTLSPDPNSPYQRIAADLRGAILCGALKIGHRLPVVAELANRYGVAASTAHRAIAELKSEGLVMASRGKPAVVSDPSKVADVVSLRKKKTEQ